MVLDGPVQYDPPEPRPHVVVHAKKKSLDIPAKILLAGAEHLRALQSENKKNQSSSDDFHSELLRLRQNWRLKKVRQSYLFAMRNKFGLRRLLFFFRAIF